jgi:uncharacterized protein (TIGR03067 family)
MITGASTRFWLLSLALSTLAPSPVDDAELKRHEGRWTVVEMTYKGQPAEPETLRPMERVVSEARVVWKREGKSFAATSLAVDPSKEPPTVDLVPEGGRFKSEPTLGIYRWEGNDRLVVCLAPPGKPRPASFTSTATNHCTLWVFERKR